MLRPAHHGLRFFVTFQCSLVVQGGFATDRRVGSNVNREVDTQLVPLLVAVLVRVVAHILVRVPVLREALSHSSAVRSPVAFKRGAADRVHLYIDTYAFSLMHA